MAYVSPYQTAAVEENLITQLLSTKRAAEEGKMQGGIQKGEMIREFGQDVRDKTSKIEAAARKAARKKRKKSPFEFIVPLATMIFGGPLAAGLGAGISAGYGADRDASFAETTARNLQKYVKDTPLTGTGKKGYDAYAGTFLSERGADFKQGRLSQAADLDSVIASAKDAGKFGNVFGQALTSGLMSYGLSSMMGGDGITDGVSVDADLMTKLSGPGGLTSAAAQNALATTALGSGGSVLGSLGNLFKDGNLGKMLLQGGKGSPQESIAAMQYLMQTIGSLQDY